MHVLIGVVTVMPDSVTGLNMSTLHAFNVWLMTSMYFCSVIPLPEPFRIVIVSSGYLRSRSPLMIIACLHGCDTVAYFEVWVRFSEPVMSFTSSDCH